MTPRAQAKPKPEVGQWWLFDGKQMGRVRRILPGGAGDMGIAEFDGLVPTAHVSTMLQYAAWRPVTPNDSTWFLHMPCKCVMLEGGIVLADGCPAHDASAAKVVDLTLPQLEERA